MAAPTSAGPARSGLRRRDGSVPPPQIAAPGGAQPGRLDLSEQAADPVTEPGGLLPAGAGDRDRQDDQKAAGGATATGLLLLATARLERPLQW
ncbi:hypothetical protein Ani05nite_06170 [Amorphoplanes nipponensis]|uniref:Uncharacterized protein n=1 Tax=Actinoplanes nipponensis TaxID=135950 RepID=A0A919JAF8_9ACTN|nr:hypothetical protein Ani05nite_06170 [Actinoplanes nipponensis]